MTARELITQYVDTGIRLPEYQVNKLNNQDKKTYIRKRLLAVKNSEYHADILAEYEFNLLTKELEEKYMSNLVLLGLRHFIEKAKDKDAVINKILTLNNNLGDFDIAFLFKTATDKEYVINRILSSDKLINKLKYPTTINLVDNAKNKESVINRLLSLDKLDGFTIGYLIRVNDDKESVINRILSSDNLINNLDSNGVYYLLMYGKDKEEVYTIKDFLFKKGVSKDIINKAINDYNYDVPRLNRINLIL
jgi:hypothetical protein